MPVAIPFHAMPVADSLQKRQQSLAKRIQNSLGVVVVQRDEIGPAWFVGAVNFVILTSSASIFDHGIEMMQLDPFRQFGPFFFTQTDHIELLHNHPSQLWPAAYWEATYHACALR